VLSGLPRDGRGFTLIEMMIAVTLVGVLLGMGIPAVRVWLLNAQIKSAADGLHNGLQLARVEAVRRNTNVRFRLDGNSGWTVGCETPRGDSDSDGLLDCPGTIQSRPSSETARVIQTITPSDARMVTFGPLGRVIANADDTPAISRLDVTVSDDDLEPEERRDMRVLVAGGSVRLCNPNVTIAGDPRSCP